MGNPLPVLSSIAEGFYTPKRLAAGIDSQGNYIDAQGNPTTYYDQPGFFEKALNPEARQVAAYNLQAGGEPLQQTTARQLSRNLIGQDIGTLPAGSMMYPGNPQASITGALNPWARPTELNPQIQAGAYGATGAPKTIGTLAGQSGINEATYGLNQSSFNLRQQNQAQRISAAQQDLAERNAKELDPETYDYKLSQLEAAKGRQLNENEKDQLVSELQLTQAQTAKRDIGITTGTQMLNNRRENYLASLMPDETVTTPYMSTIGLGGIQTSGGQLSPMFRPPAAAMMQSMRNGTYMGGSPTVAGPDGGSMPPRNPVVTPTLGITGQQSDLQQGSYPDIIRSRNSPNLKPLDDYPDFTADYDTGRLYYQGHDVTNDQRVAPMKQAAIEQGVREQKDAKDAHKTARVKALEAEKAAIEAEHLQTTGSQFLPALGREGALISAPITVPAMVGGHAIWSGIKGAGHLIGRGSEAALNSLGYEQ